MIDKINTILNPKFKENCNGSPFDLLEDEPDSKCKIARFQYNEGEVIAYKFDKKQEGQDNTIFPFFADGVTDLKKMCDFILFYQNKNQDFFVVLCNLKSDTKGSDKPQLAASETFVNFIIDTVKRLNPTENTDFTLKKVHYRSNQKGVQEHSLKRKHHSVKDDYYYYSAGNYVTACNLSIICRK